MRGLIINDVSCVHGCDCEEDEIHVFFTCSFAKGLWFVSSWGMRWRDRAYEDVHEFLKQIWNPEFLGPISNRDREDVILFSSLIMDHIWWVRNERLHRDNQVSLEASVWTVLERFNEFKFALSNLLIPDNRSLTDFVHSGWSPPSKRVIKINLDAAVKGHLNFLGIVAPNEHGDVMEIHSFKVCTQDPLTAELMAIKEAMELSLKNVWKQIICEANAQNIIYSLNGENAKMLHWKLEPIIKDMLNLRKCFLNVKFVWCYHNINTSAHLIVKWAALHKFIGFILPYCFTEPFFNSLLKD